MYWLHFMVVNGMKDVNHRYGYIKTSYEDVKIKENHKVGQIPNYQI